MKVSKFETEYGIQLMNFKLLNIVNNFCSEEKKKYIFILHSIHGI